MRVRSVAMGLVSLGLAAVTPRAAEAAHYVYDSANRLVASEDETSTTRYRWDGEGHLVAVCTGPAGTMPTCRELVLDERSEPPQVLGKIRRASTTALSSQQYVHGPTGLMAQRAIPETGEPSELYFALTDADGSVRALSNERREVVSRRSYEAYGALRHATGTVETDFGWRGAFTGPEGATWHGERHYVGALGRFGQTDAFTGVPTEPSTFQPYTWPLANPVNTPDPTGQFDPATGFALGVAVTTAVLWGDTMAQGVQAPMSPWDPTVEVVRANNAALPSRIAGDMLAGYAGDVAFAYAYRAAAWAARGLRQSTANAIARVGVARNVGCSFEENTEVSTPDGPRPIGSIRVGDLVYAGDPASGRVSVERVRGKTATPDEAVVVLDIRGDSGQVESIATTANHPFFARGRGFVEAGVLRAGSDAVATPSGWATVDALREGGRDTMHNLDVDGPDTFFVGKSRVLVHNCDWVKPAELAARFRRRFGLDEVARDGHDLSHALGGYGLTPGEEALAVPRWEYFYRYIADFGHSLDAEDINMFVAMQFDTDRRVRSAGWRAAVARGDHTFARIFSPVQQPIPRVTASQVARWTDHLDEIAAHNNLTRQEAAKRIIQWRDDILVRPARPNAYGDLAETRRRSRF